ncbi:MAG: thioredoxin family protein [Candidatus Thorarchaeota archaeon]|nr:MAG: thioredoxin family protein [Candidatus Thorarchaeota archaeon]
MILLFTSYHCTWCDVVRKMVEDENENIASEASVFEVNVEEYPTFASLYNVLVVPTLVSGRTVISGVPSESDLRSFMLQSVSSQSGSDVKLKIQAIMKSRKQVDVPSRLTMVESRMLDMMGVKNTSCRPREEAPREKVCERSGGQSKAQ